MCRNPKERVGEPAARRCRESYIPGGKRWENLRIRQKAAYHYTEPTLYQKIWIRGNADALGDALCAQDGIELLEG